MNVAGREGMTPRVSQGGVLLARVARRVGKSYKSKMQGKVFLALLLLCGVFTFFFVPDEVTVPLRAKLSAIGTGLISTAIASSGIYFYLQWVVFAQDHLANGRSISSMFFRHYYPSSFARQKYGISIQRANRIWFDYYNAWQREDHPRHACYRTNANRTYSLRLIYYLKYLLLYFSIVAGAVTLGNKHLLHEAAFGAMLAPRLAFILIALAIAVIIIRSNNCTARADANFYERYAATGAYEKYKEFQGVLWELFDEEVLEPLKRSKSMR